MILDITNFCGVLNYWFEWAQQKGKFVASDEAITNWPRLVFQFLESKLVWTDDNSTPHLEEIMKLQRLNQLSKICVGNQMSKFFYISFSNY